MKDENMLEIAQTHRPAACGLRITGRPRRLKTIVA